MTKPKIGLGECGGRRVLIPVMLMAAAMSPLQASGRSAIEPFETPTVSAFSEACRPVRLQHDGAILTAEQQIGGSMCMGYFLSEVDGEPFLDPKYCPPSGVSLKHLVLSFLRWADENPSAADLDRKLGVQFSLISAYPCPKD